MDINKVGVCGCGLMGHGIAQVAAQAGCDVVVLESSQDFLDKGFSRIEGSLAKLVEKEKIGQDDADAARGRISGTLDMNELADCDLVVEAIVEDLAVKRDFFASLGETVKADCILASNTSSFPVAELGAASGRPDRTVGLHFFNPVQLMGLVEVVRTDDTSDEVLEAARAFGERVGKSPVTAADTPGFIVNRLLVPYMAEAMRMLDRGDATAADIDTAMKLGCGYPMGPFTLTDYVGLDTTLSILEGWQERFPGEPLYETPDCLQSLVDEGKLGRKTGMGFFDWSGDKRS